MEPSPGLKRKLRTALKWAWMHILCFSGMIRWARWRLRAQGAVVVLTFHRILPDEEYLRTRSPAGMVVRQKTFQDLLEHVSRRCTVAGLSNGLPNCERKSRQPMFVFTFDDAWEDNARIAVPLAQRYDIPVAIFVCPGRVGTPLAFWPERVAALCEAAEDTTVIESVLAPGARERSSRARPRGRGMKRAAEEAIELIKALPAETRDQVVHEISKELGCRLHAFESPEIDVTMTWDQVAKLAENGVTIGSHSQSHEILTGIPPARAEYELTKSKLEIEQKLHRPCPLFSYPNGSWTHAVRDLVKRAGYRLAFLNQPGFWTRETDPLLIPRVNIWEGMLVGPGGRFSRIAFEYAAIWQPYRAGRPITPPEGMGPWPIAPPDTTP